LRPPFSTFDDDGGITEPYKEPSMSGVWILLGLAVLAMIVGTAGWVHGRADRSNLGFVSARWLSEQRLSQSQDHK
jgi:hypothetical protein